MGEVLMDRSPEARSLESKTTWRLFSIVLLAIIFLLAMSGLALADTWSDISGAAWQDVYRVSAEEAATVADGYPDGTFRPDQAVTRGQLAKMVADGLEIPLADPATPSFSDVAPNFTFYQPIEGDAAAGVIFGYPDGTFRPAADITRQQTASILGQWLAQQEIAALSGVQGAKGYYASPVAWYVAEGEGVLEEFADQGQVAVIHTRYDLLSVLRSMELIIGTDPLSLNDALASPMYDVFTSEPLNSAPVDIVPANIDLLTYNMQAPPWPTLSAGLPLGEIDAVPQRMLEAILWKTVHGFDSTPHPPGPNAEYEE
jgi:hypothetical protein